VRQDLISRGEALLIPPARRPGRTGVKVWIFGTGFHESDSRKKTFSASAFAFGLVAFTPFEVPPPFNASVQGICSNVCHAFGNSFRKRGYLEISLDAIGVCFISLKSLFDEIKWCYNASKTN
jgi:hypothetical protein